MLRVACYSLPLCRSYRSYTGGNSSVPPASFCKRIRWVVKALRQGASFKHSINGVGLSLMARCMVFSTNCASVAPRSLRGAGGGGGGAAAVAVGVTPGGVCVPLVAPLAEGGVVGDSGYIIEFLLPGISVPTLANT